MIKLLRIFCKLKFKKGIQLKKLKKFAILSKIDQDDLSSNIKQDLARWSIFQILLSLLGLN